MSELVKEAREFWSKVASNNGWSMKDRGVTVWIDIEGDLVDSLYNTEDSDTSYIVDNESQELIKEIKH